MSKSASQYEQVPVFILAGGFGTRLSEETTLKPKPMVEIGNVPILVHIMRWYYSFGFNDFVICGGYKAWDIKEYFLNYSFRNSHLNIDHRQDLYKAPEAEGSEIKAENWRVRVLETGVESMTGSRLARGFDYVSSKQNFSQFAVTYGDGLTNANMAQEFDWHVSKKRTGTLLGFQQASRFGEMEVGANGAVKQFTEKPEDARGYINGGFFFFKSEFRKYLDPSGPCVLEREPLQALVRDQQLSVYEHKGFWQCMDTLRDRTTLQGIWDSGKAPWKPLK